VQVGVATTTLSRTRTATRPITDACAVEVVSDADAFARLEPEWNDAVERAGIAHPFLQHEWMWTWWQCFGAGCELQLVIVRSGGRIIAIAPLLAETTTIVGIPVRQLRMLFNEHTPRTEFIVCESGERAYRAIWHALTDLRSRWDVLLLGQLPRESRTREMAVRLAGECGEAIGVWRSSDSPYLSLAGTWDSYFGGLSGKFRSNVRNRTARLERLGPVDLESVDAPAAIDRALSDTFRLEASGWKQSAGTAITSDARVQRFYTMFASRAAARGWLRLQFLNVGGERIATSYSLVYGNRLFLCKTGYDPSFETGSPFKVLTSLATEQAYADGLEELDFLGDTEPWKLEWTPTVRSHDWLYVFSRTLRARLAHALKFRVGPALRRTQHLAPSTQHLAPSTQHSAPSTRSCLSRFTKA
jgi:CelD/BcsL family acetyltransferase involved in cellulose biosynthesis